MISDQESEHEEVDGLGEHLAPNIEFESVEEPALVGLFTL